MALTEAKPLEEPAEIAKSSLDSRDKIIGEMTERNLVDFVNDNWREAQERMRPMSAIQDTLWMLYRNRDDFSDKEDWQSRAALPKAFAVVKQAAANLAKLLFYSDEWIRVKGYGIEQLLERPVSLALNTLFKSKDFEFIDAFEHAMESALACNLGILKVVPAHLSMEPLQFVGNETKRRRSNAVTLRASAVDYRRFAYGPYTSHHKFDWCAEDSTVPWAYLKRAQDANGKPRFRNLDRLEKESFEEPPEEVKSWVRFDFAQPWMRSNLRLNLTGIREWYGDIIDFEGQVVGYNKKITIFNRKWLGAVEDNPFPWPPYAVFSPLAVAFRFPGEGILEAGLELFRTANRLANLKVDSQFYSELKQFEVDLSLLENKEDILTGIEPGKMYRKRQGTGAQPAIREIQISGNKPTSFEMDQRVDAEIERGTFYADVPTDVDLASEQKELIAKASTMMLNMAERIERHGLDRVAEMAFTEMVMFLDSNTRPNWELLLGAPNPLDKMTRAQRQKLIGTNYLQEFNGLSESIRLRERAQRILEALQLASQNPMYQAMVDIPRMFTDLMKAIGAADYVNPQAAANYQELMRQAIQAKAAEPQQKLAMVGKQFQMRNEEAMKRDAFRHQLKRDDMLTKVGVDAGSEPATAGPAPAGPAALQ